MKRKMIHKDILIFGSILGTAINIAYILMNVLDSSSVITSWYWYALFFVSTTIGLGGMLSLMQTINEATRNLSYQWVTPLICWVIFSVYECLITFLMDQHSKVGFSNEKLVEIISITFVLFVIAAFYLAFFKRRPEC